MMKYAMLFVLLSGIAFGQSDPFAPTSEVVVGITPNGTVVPVLIEHSQPAPSWGQTDPRPSQPSQPQYQQDRPEFGSPTVNPQLERIPVYTPTDPYSNPYGQR
jgi:hypothetical protein